VRDLKHAFSPNKALSPTTFSLLCGFQALAALAVWHFASSPVLPRPGAIAHAWVELIRTGDFLSEIVVSGSLACQAVAITFLVSLAISYASVLPFFQPLAAVISKMRFLSLVGLSFVFTLMMSGGHSLKVALLVFGMVVFFVTSMVDIIRAIPKNELSHARTLGLSEWQVVWEVIILGRMDQAFEILRQNFAIAWMMLTLVEGISRAEGGVGALLLNQNKHLHLDAVFAIQATIFAIGILADYLLGVLRRFLFPYATLQLETR
jgi:ABC-type nitrate/sulfonate/bicarbonate transport system permease component